MRLALRATLLTVAACGRIDFAATSDTPPPIDVPRLPSGAVFYLSFSDGFLDEAGDHSVSCMAACPTPGAGHSGPGYFFDPTGPDILVAPFANDLDPTGGFTIALWVRLQSTPPPPYMCALMKPVGSGTNNSWGLCVRDDLAILYHTGNVSGTDNLIGRTIALGEWHHLAMTWDQTTKRGYLDGAVDGSRDVPVGNDTNPLVIGADLNSGTPAYPVHGELDEVVIFNRALSPSEIGNLAR